MAGEKSSGPLGWLAQHPLVAMLAGLFAVVAIVGTVLGEDGDTGGDGSPTTTVPADAATDDAFGAEGDDGGAPTAAPETDGSSGEASPAVADDAGEGGAANVDDAAGAPDAAGADDATATVDAGTDGGATPSDAGGSGTGDAGAADPDDPAPAGDDAGDADAGSGSGSDTGSSTGSTQTPTAPGVTEAPSLDPIQTGELVPLVEATAAVLALAGSAGARLATFPDDCVTTFFTDFESFGAEGSFGLGADGTPQAELDDAFFASPFIVDIWVRACESAEPALVDTAQEQYDELVDQARTASLALGLDAAFERSFAS